MSQQEWRSPAIEPHLPKTHLDGAAMELADRTPVVALTLRYDRLDKFWFTLFHVPIQITYSRVRSRKN